ncbi:N-acetylglucosamine-6-phosphate deacetylase [Cellulomonas biazotea]|uniref:N-acetylglucosamine-6-phosphate deacetylase n=1 Tax=Cellulomonas biazotea TaxID=1709 RepID=UPI0010322195|nr:amidohydrolase family protein [Cellulomonas biazotea]
MTGTGTVRGRVVTGSGVRDAVVAYVDGRIVDVAASSDAPDVLVLPGLVDVHCHGAEGRSFGSPRPETWRAVRRAHLRHGTTTLLPTLATATPDAMAAALATGRRLVAAGAPGIAGLHLEGPFVAPPFRGAHAAGLVRSRVPVPLPPPVDDLDGVRVVTFAPELPGADALLASCVRAGVTASAGHTAATPADLDAAAAAGLTHVAHLWSGHSRLEQDGPVRRPGLLEAVLASDAFTAEAIMDGRHLTAVLARIAYRCLGPDRLCLVSDASPGAGLHDGASFDLAGGTATVRDGVAWSADGRSYCGSTSFLLDVLRFAVRVAGIGLVDAVRMATTTPARAVGLPPGTGDVVVGGPATFVLLRPDLSVAGVVEGGERVV